MHTFPGLQLILQPSAFTFGGFLSGDVAIFQEDRAALRLSGRIRLADNKFTGLFLSGNVGTEGVDLKFNVSSTIIGSCSSTDPTGAKSEECAQFI
jgi:hypothetical protein